MFNFLYNKKENNLRKVECVVPPNQGWLELNLSSEEMDFLWHMIEERKEESFNYALAGNITGSYAIKDNNNWFFDNVLAGLIQLYCDKFGKSVVERMPLNRSHLLRLHTFWVNYQRQNEFNPLHDHAALFSFVIWMKIPFDWVEQNQLDIAKNSNAPTISEFQFAYLDVLGRQCNYAYKLSAKDEGKMLFFPGRLNHIVYPFYNCDEERISISGNIVLDTSQAL